MGIYEVLAMLLAAVTKRPDMSDVRNEGLVWAHGLKVQSNVAEKTWRQEHEADGHYVNTQEQRENACWDSARRRLFIQSGISTCGTVLLTFGVALLPPVNTSRNSLVDMPRVVTDTVKVTALIVTPELASETP